MRQACKYFLLCWGLQLLRSLIRYGVSAQYLKVTLFQLFQAALLGGEGVLGLVGALDDAKQETEADE